MREVGLIIKKARTNNYGFVETMQEFIQPKSYFFHQDQARFLISSVDLYTPVTFEASIAPRTNRLEAENVLLLPQENDRSILEHCLGSINQNVWKPIFNKALLAIPIDRAVTIAKDKLNSLPHSEREHMAKFLPDELLMHSKELRLFICNEDRLRLYINILENNQNDEFSNEILRELAEVAAALRNKDILKNIPLDILKKSISIRQCLPAQLYAVCLVKIICGIDDSTNDHTLLFELRDLLRASCYTSLWKKIPEHIKKINIIFDVMPPEMQIDYIWPNKQEVSWEIFSKLSLKTKIFCIYRIAKENVRLLGFDSEMEPDLLLQSALIFLWAKQNPKHSSEAFTKAHTKLQDYIIDRAWESTTPLDLDPVLPTCENRVIEYCEAKPWFTPEDKEQGYAKAPKAFCPRANKPCGLFAGDVVESGLIGACLYANCDQKITKWSLLELIENVGIVPKLPELQRPDEYVPKLSGWVNRLNEIRERLKCSVCAKIMRPNYKYARNLAKYNATVVSCQDGVNHDKDIYLNHCWACHKIIDSRESRIRKEGYYICIHCGSGPQFETRYRQGDVCPKCGGSMYQSKFNSNSYYCPNRDCKHEIWLPPKHKITG